MTRPLSADVEYLGMAPGLSDGVGIAITTFRPRNQHGVLRALGASWET